MLRSWWTRRIRCRMGRKCFPVLCCYAKSFSAGGVYILGGHGKIVINNTFEERLHILETDALPSMRTTLFGKNENRKFVD